MKTTNIKWNEAEALLNRHYQIYDKKRFTRHDKTNRKGYRLMELYVLSRIGDVLQLVIKDNDVVGCLLLHETPTYHRYLGCEEISTTDELREALEYVYKPTL